MRGFNYKVNVVEMSNLIIGEAGYLNVHVKSIFHQIIHYSEYLRDKNWTKGRQSTYTFQCINKKDVRPIRCF